MRIGIGDGFARNSGNEFLIAIEVTCSDGYIPGRMVRIQEPKEDHTSFGNTEERYCKSPWAIMPI